jgi:hypothetical protein
LLVAGPKTIARWVFVGVIALGGTSMTHGDAAPQRSRLRPLDDTIGQLLRLGYRQSPTFRRVVEDLERSDVVAHLETGATDRVQIAGVTRFAGQRGGQRHVRIVVADSRRPRSVTVAVLGHELYHALEVARARWVIDDATYHTLYQQIGYPSCAPPAVRCFDTREAFEIGTQILREFQDR